MGKSKIVLSFFQIMMLSKTVYRVPFPTVFVDFMDKLSFLRFELFKLVPFRCVAPYTFHNILDITIVVALLLILPPWARVAHGPSLIAPTRLSGCPPDDVAHVGECVHAAPHRGRDEGVALGDS